jgi:hypothetical protein
MGNFVGFDFAFYFSAEFGSPSVRAPVMSRFVTSGFAQQDTRLIPLSLALWSDDFFYRNAGCEELSQQ